MKYILKQLARIFDAYANIISDNAAYSVPSGGEQDIF